MDAEERLKATIKKWEANLIARIQGTSESGRAEIEKWVAEYIAALQVEMPLSVKQVLDRGGAVRSYLIPKEDVRFWPPELSLLHRPSGREWYMRLEEMGASYPPQTSKSAIRVTIIVEPVSELAFT